MDGQNERYRSYQLPRLSDKAGSFPRSGDVFYRPPVGERGFPSDMALNERSPAEWFARHTNGDRNGVASRPYSASTDRGMSEERPMVKKQKTIGSLVSSFADTTSLQGPPFIMRAGRWYSRSIWVFILILAFGATTAHLYYVCTQYYSYDSTTKITLGYKSLPFPSISICNINPIRISKLRLASPALHRYITQLAPRTSIDPKYRKDSQESNNNPTQPPTANPDTGSNNAGTSLSANTPSGGKITGQQTTKNVATNPPQTTSGQNSGPVTPATTGKPPPTQQPNGRRKRDVAANYTSRPMPGKNGLLDEFKDGPPTDSEGEDLMASDFGLSASVDPHSQKIADFRYLLAKESLETRFEMGHQKETFILSCAYNGRQCDSVNFTALPPSSLLGNCYAFNSVDDPDRNKSIYTRRAGAMYGLDLTLYIEHFEYIKGLTGGSGVRFDIHPFDTMPFVEENGMSAAPGAETEIGLKMMNISRLGGDYGTCINSGKFRQMYNRKYTINGCLYTCTHQQIAKICKCYMPEHEELYPKNLLRNLLPCDYSNDTVSACVLKQENSFLVSNSQCSQECQQPCREINYEAAYSTNTWPDPGLYYSLVQDVCQRANSSGCHKLQDYDDVNKALSKNFVRLKIFYRDLNFQTVQQVPDYEFSQFLSDVGGCVGLWVGATFVTVFEILDLFTQILIFLCKKMCNRSLNKKQKWKSPSVDRNPDRRQFHPIKRENRF